MKIDYHKIPSKIKRKENMSKTKDYTAGLISGALIGSVLALLFAPDKGSNTRDIVSYRLRTYADELRRLIDELANDENMPSDARKRGDMVVEDARERAEGLIKEAEDMLSEMEKK